MRFDQALAFVERYGVDLITDPQNGLRGVAVGRKNQGPITGGGEFCVSAFVERKFDEPTLRENRIRTFHPLFRERAGADGLPTGPNDADVVSLGGPLRLHAFAGSDHAKPATVNTQKWFLAPRSGVSICNPIGYPDNLGAGTLGFVVDDGSDRYLVSNNHVLARENAAKIGEDIVQPGTRDLNGHDIDRLTDTAAVSNEFKIAELSTIIRVDLWNSRTRLTNTVDAAIARFTPSNRSDAAHSRHGYGGRLADFGPPYAADANGDVSGSAYVTKVGRTTGYTEGYVANVAARIEVDFGSGKAVFVDQLAVYPDKDNCGIFSTEGDSGSALVNHDHQIVGLIFAGGPLRSLANPIDEVINALKSATGKTLKLA